MVRFTTILTLALLIATIFSCTVSRDGIPNPVPDLTFLTSWEKMNKITQAELATYWGNNDTANAFIQYDVSAYKITYQSTGFDGTPITLSGAILIPENSAPNSVIAIQHATFFADAEAPSINKGFSVVARKSIFAAHGYIVFLPDYYGYGVDKQAIHPYHHAESLQLAAKDMLLAGYEFLKNQEIDHNQQLFLAGYSEGAYATAALQQVIENRTDLPATLTATSLGSGAYNLKATFEQFTSDISQPFGCTPCNAFLLQSYNAVYQIGHPLTTYFQEPYSSVIESGLFLGAYDAPAIAQQLPSNPAELYNPVFILNYYNGTETAWATALAENSIHQWQPKHPTLLSHNLQDNVSPFFNSEELAKFNQNNPNLTFLPISNTDHFSGIFQWGILTMDYFDKF